MHTLKTLLGNYSIVIPMIQRDYAQGRLSTEVTTIRKSIVGKLRAATIDGTPVDLDFIYGAIKDGTLRPLDGQQRLTSLYLLYWYIGYRRREFPEYLKRFTYETRITARDFFHALVEFPILGGEAQTIHERICNQKWFRTNWLLDPTIAGALVMLNELELAFRDVETDLLPDLVNQEPDVSFHFLDLDKYDLDESLYIKMNSRGKPLSPFDNFKAQFEQHLFESDMKDEWEAYKQKVEIQWGDLLWPYRDKASQTIDNVFLNIFRYWTSAIVLKEMDFERREEQKEFLDSLTVPSRFTSIYQSPQNVRDLFSVLDMWTDSTDLETTFKFYTSQLTHIAPDLLDRLLKVDLFKLSYDDQIVIYTILRMKQHGVEELDLVRVVRNLAEGVRQKKQGGYTSNIRFERLGSIYQAIDALIADHGLLSKRIERSMMSVFPTRVVQHEIDKRRYVEAHETMKEALHQLEDLDMLKGMTHRVFPAFKVYGEPFVKRFKELLGTRPSLWTRAMLAIGDYGLIDGYSSHSERYIFGGEKYARFVWTHQLVSEKEEFKKNLQPVLDTLFDSVMNEGKSIENCLEDLIKNCTLSANEWRYYFLKYDGTLTDEGHMFTFPDEDNLIVERLSGSRVGKYFINPIYAEMHRQLGDAVYPFTEAFSKLETADGVILFLQEGKWTVEGDVDREQLHTELSRWSYLDRVEQGVNLVNWLSQKNQIVTP
ncbi:DUF262 domain-containing protein [Exiguobacterium sp. s149]|uniref:DUF262 domain-containing protein n=1 Tax=Exiguobacterium TaxID=33986 RepID=UPI001BE944E0|nr:DUF262 domain-containing protein [Exiguobacterium sp. s149]